jgi:hypothetical protein
VSRVGCGDEHRDLPCRCDAAYRQFLADWPACAWLFRADDDTFINTVVIYHHLLHLSAVYDGRETIVFRAHANLEGLGKYYIHGGAGWLCSRAYVEAHVRRALSIATLAKWARYHQQDTAESIVVRAMFPHPEAWDEMGIEGYPCANCNAEAIAAGRWDMIPHCPDNTVAVRVSDLFAIHTAGLKEPAIAFIRAIPLAPPDVMLAGKTRSQTHTICRRGPRTLVWDPKRRPLAFLRDEDLPEPLIDYDTLPDDNGE